MAIQKDISRRTDGAVRPKKSQIQDDSIMATNNSSIVSKRSVERLYYAEEPHFFRHFVKKPQRRSPLINRGYWLRMKAIDEVVRQFLEQDSCRPKVVINLGCGYDPLPWQCLSRYASHCRGVKFLDIDYKDLMLKKRDMVCSTKELNSMFTNVELSDGNILYRSDQYVQLGCDLRDLKLLNTVLAEAVDVENSSILLTAEVSITYMDVKAADALIGFTSNLPDARFCLLEQIIPDGLDHPFARTMMAHFDKLGTSLKAAQRYPTTLAQEKRFKDLGWSKASARNLWRLWNDSTFMSQEERLSLDLVEPFDEWEEFALFGCHYFLLVADNDTSHASPETDRKISQNASDGITATMGYVESPKNHGCRRFAAVLPLRGSDPRADDRVGVFAGMGLNTRVNSTDVYSGNSSGWSTFSSQRGSVVPSSRMCHTITDLGECGALLVGGRTGPDSACADSWLYHRWLDVWERVDDMPQPLYRHGAVSIGSGCVLVSLGRRNSKSISSSFYVWSRALGWNKCQQVTGENPVRSYGSTFMAFGGAGNAAEPSSGLLAGGMSEDGLLLEDVWEWILVNPTSNAPILTFKRASEPASLLPDIARFGASVAGHGGMTWVVGGIFKNELLTEANEVCLVHSHSHISRAVPSRSASTPRPLLIGSSIICKGGTLLVTGGSAVCFSFGTYWNTGSYTVEITTSRNEAENRNIPRSPTWRFSHTMAAANMGSSTLPSSEVVRPIVSVARERIESASEFELLTRSAKPVILEGLDLGSCTNSWTSEYMKEKIGSKREVVVHEATSELMDFQSKNFTYATKSFGDFIDQIDLGGRLYLRSLSSERPAEVPANISRDFPSIAQDFRLPPSLALVNENIHSSPLRISGPVVMWLHYDVMANVLCQIRGSKRLLLFPPSDIQHLQFKPGASSSSVNVFDDYQKSIPGDTHPHEVLLNPGDVLYLPPMWLHTASPTSGVSIAVNVFFRNLDAGYAAGKDVYGNRDLQAYEKGRQDIAKIFKSFDSLPADVRGFYLKRLSQEFQGKAC